MIEFYLFTRNVNMCAEYRRIDLCQCDRMNKACIWFAHFHLEAVFEQWHCIAYPLCYLPLWRYSRGAS
jgi:hypothetical protein